MSRWSSVWRRWRSLPVPLPTLADLAPPDLRIVGRTLLHSVLVGIAAGLAGAVFFGGLEYVQRFILEDLAGYVPLRAHGETFTPPRSELQFRPWMLMLLPALGGLGCGLLTRLAPETRGGGSDAMIDAFHHQGGVIRARVIWVKSLASFLTLGTGGAGGREGPTMQIGGALGSLVGGFLSVGPRERRILMVAGVAAGIAAVFRTPLGAALLAVEVLYRDDFESDALVPAILASVVAYSVVISIYGESTLFAHAPRFPFEPKHLPLYALLALLISGLAIVFTKVYRAVREATVRLPMPDWLKPAAGGLALGVLFTPVIVLVGRQIGAAGQGLGILGGGYGAVQMAISGSPWLPEGWTAVGLLVMLSVAKLFAASLTIGSGGSAGDFAPSLAIGGMFGGAFGRVAQILLNDPRLDPGAFALVGMGAFYGGIAHVPLSALVLVCELAGNYDLLVPLMLALGISFVTLRKHSLYHSQLPTLSTSPAHRERYMGDVLQTVRVSTLYQAGRQFCSFSPRTTLAGMLQQIEAHPKQEVFPVSDEHGNAVGMVTTTALRSLSGSQGEASWILAADVMQPLVSITLDDNLQTAAGRMVSNSLRELPVVGAAGKVVGMLDENDIALHYLAAARTSETGGRAKPT